MKQVRVPSNASTDVKLILQVLGLPVLEKCIDDVRKGRCPRGHGKLEMGRCDTCKRGYSAQNVPSHPTLHIEFDLFIVHLPCMVHGE